MEKKGQEYFSFFSPIVWFFSSSHFFFFRNNLSAIGTRQPTLTRKRERGEMKKQEMGCGEARDGKRGSRSQGRIKGKKTSRIF